MTRTALRRPILVLALFLLPAAAASGQVRGTRFEITAVGDSTFSFAIGTAQWVQPGLTGIAVNPRDRDVLVARFRVIAANGRTAVGLITGLTTRLTADHVAIMEQPPQRFFKTLGFWGGVVVGFVAGVLIGATR